jgi:hypothetical protein
VSFSSGDSKFANAFVVTQYKRHAALHHIAGEDEICSYAPLTRENSLRQALCRGGMDAAGGEPDHLGLN